MRHDKLQRELDLILLLAENRTYTVEQLCERLNVSRRNLYYYFDFLRFSNFRFERRGRYYHIDRQSPFFKKLFEMLDFTEDEAIFLRRLLEGADNKNPQVESIKRKLERFYDFDIIQNVELRERRSQNVSTLYDAIKFRQIAKICGYSSPHSKTVSDRIVEPFMLMNNNNEVRCFEIASKQCKTFKLSRMERVELIDLQWSYADQHKEMFTDIFMFSDENPKTVSMTLGSLSANIMREEYPQAEQYMTQQEDGLTLLSMPVCSYLGIGRFVLGLYDDINVIGNDEFKAYLSDKIKSFSSPSSSNSNIGPQTTSQ